MVVMQMRLLMLLLLGDLWLPVGAQRRSQGPRRGVHPSEPAVTVLHRAQDVCNREGSGVLWAQGHGAATPCPPVRPCPLLRLDGCVSKVEFCLSPPSLLPAYCFLRHADKKSC